MISFSTIFTCDAEDREVGSVWEWLESPTEGSTDVGKSEEWIMVGRKKDAHFRQGIDISLGGVRLLSDGKIKMTFS